MNKPLQPLVYPLAERAVAFSTTRHGGVGSDSYATMNITHYCGDEPRCVAENRRILARWLDIDEGRIVVPRQTHQTEVRLISENNHQNQALLEGVDALITATPSLCIGISTADCIPIIIYDPVNHAAAAIHAGWRGTVERIAQKAVRAMTDAFGSRPSSLLAVVGPGISLDAFEVGDEVYAAFQSAGFPMSDIARPYPAAPFANDGASARRDWKWHIDLPACNRQQLVQLGLAQENIYMSDICTFSHTSDFFSARRLGIRSGRIFTGIMLR